VRIHLIAIGTRMPGWVSRGFEEYARRLPRHLELKLVEVPAIARARAVDVDRARREEGTRLLNRVPGNSRVVALAETGVPLSSGRLAAAVEDWMGGGRDVALMVGGADGLSNDCIERADECWSLSALTFPHPLVRVILAEQLFRAWSIISNHPYHRD
jgi:23S rRNA (pseudouridine1915-N3)-methyltransferase